ncbi:MAG TPA: N-acetylmuramic acid 6-phosphate etherase [Thermomicrobiales bacterium]|nr:N-acetylmuramic acid 6-phosphate etherase [Thermomicrobiales bacterium]
MLVTQDAPATELNHAPVDRETMGRNDPPAAPDLATLGSLSTEQRNPATADIDAVDTVTMLETINDQDALVAGAVRAEIPSIAAAIDAIANRMRQGGRLVSIGAGTSGRLGVLDASECPPTFNTPPDLVVGLIAGGDRALRHPIEAVEDRPGEGAAALDAIGLTPDDSVIGIAASGRTPYVLGAIDRAKQIGALTIGLSTTTNSQLSKAVDIAITPVVGPEVITGSTRLKSGTAQKLVLNMISTGVMIRLGKTYGNLMVDVQPTNAKLRRRAVAIVRDAADIDEAQAESLLAQAGNDVKAAIVMGRLGIDPETARERLDAASGILRDALGERQ